MYSTLSYIIFAQRSLCKLVLRLYLLKYKHGQKWVILFVDTDECWCSSRIFGIYTMGLNVEIRLAAGQYLLFYSRSWILKRESIPTIHSHARENEYVDILAFIWMHLKWSIYVNIFSSYRIRFVSGKSFGLLIQQSFIVLDYIRCRQRSESQ